MSTSVSVDAVNDSHMSMITTDASSTEAASSASVDGGDGACVGGSAVSAGQPTIRIESAQSDF